MPPPAPSLPCYHNPKLQWCTCYNWWTYTDTSLSPKVHSLHGGLLLPCILSFDKYIMTRIPQTVSNTIVYWPKTLCVPLVHSSPPPSPCQSLILLLSPWFCLLVRTFKGSQAVYLGWEVLKGMGKLWAVLRNSKIQDTYQKIIRTSNAVVFMHKLKTLQVTVRPREGKWLTEVT